MRPLIALVVLVLSCTFSNLSRAQSSVVYGHPNADEEGYEVIATSDGGYMVGGHYTDTTTHNVQYWIVKVNARGAVAWDTVYDLGFDRAFLWSIQPDGNGGALLGGYTGVQNSGTESALVLDIDSVGHIIKQYDLNYARADHAHWFAHRKQGGYFWAGHTDSESDSTGVMILMRLGENFDSVWQKTYSYRANSGEHAHCGTLTSDGGCVLAGHLTLNGQEHTWAVRVDSNGNEVWKKLFVYSGSQGDSPYGIITTREGNFAVFGGIDFSSSSAMRLLLLDSAGNKIADKRYGNNYAWSYDGFQTSDGGFVVVGATQTQTTSNALAARTDAVGNMKWEQQYNGLGYAWGYAGFQHDDQYVLIGGTQDPNLSQGDLWALYVDTNGNQVPYDTGRIVGPHGLTFNLDTATITYALDDFNPKQDTLYGSITNIGDDSTKFVATIPPPFASNWVIVTTILGRGVGGAADTFSIAPHETLPVMLRIAPYAERADTEHYCVHVQELSDIAGPQEHCTELIVLPSGAGVRPEQPKRLTLWPNPADKFLTLSNVAHPLPYRIYNAASMLVLSGAAADRIDVSSLATGAYEITIGGEVRQFVVQR